MAVVLHEVDKAKLTVYLNSATGHAGANLNVVRNIINCI